MPTSAQRLFAIQRQRAQRDSNFEPIRDIRRGYLVEIDGSIEGSRSGYVWFKSLEDNTPPREVFNPGSIQNVRAGMYCEIERNPKEPARWQILRFDTGIYFDDQSTYESLPGLSNVGPHATDHEWVPGRPGADVMTVYPRSISDFAVRPTSPASMKVRVFSGWYPGESTYQKFSGPVNSADLTSYIPGTSGQAAIVAITIDTSGTLGYTAGSAYVDGLPVPAASLPSVSTDTMIISAVRLVNGMTEITEGNFDAEIRPVLGPGGLSVANNYWSENGSDDVYRISAVGIGVDTIPKGGVGSALLAIEGRVSALTGPHIQLTVDTDNYPVFSLVGYDHDSTYLNFDAYWQSGWFSSDAGSNFQIRKILDKLDIQYSSGNAQGAGVGWTKAFTVDVAGEIVVNDSGADMNFRVEGDTDQNLIFVDAGNDGVGIGTATVPHSSIGSAKLAMDGTDSSEAAGPHVQVTTASDNYPVFSMLNWSHDNWRMQVDAYYQSGDKSSDAGSNFRLIKISDKLRFDYSTGNSQGAAVSYSNGMTIDLTNGRIGYGGVTTPNSTVEYGLATENLEIVDAGSTAATEQDWIEVQVGGNTGYIRVFATK